MNDQIKVTGSCHCGKIQVSGKVSEDMVIACHCTDCQHCSGAPFWPDVIAKGADVRLEGQPREYANTADSGNTRLQGFCGDCGTQFYAADPDKTTYNIRTGWLDQRDNLVPKIHIFGKLSPDWLTGIADHNWLSQSSGSNAYNPDKAD